MRLIYKLIDLFSNVIEGDYQNKWDTCANIKEGSAITGYDIHTAPKASEKGYRIYLSYVFVLGDVVLVTLSTQFF